MDISTVYGLDEFFSQLTNRFPEVRLFVTRKNETVFVSAEGLGQTTVKTAEGEAGPLIREALVDLHGRCVLADMRLSALSQNGVAGLRAQEEARAQAVVDRLKAQIQTADDALDMLCLDNFPNAVAFVQRHQQLSEELSRLRSQLLEAEEELSVLLDGDDEDYDYEDYEEEEDDLESLLTDKQGVVAQLVEGVITHEEALSQLAALDARINNLRG